MTPAAGDQVPSRVALAAFRLAAASFALAAAGLALCATFRHA